jgi:hypothetical protein
MFIVYPTDADGWAQVYPDIAMPEGYFDDFDEARAINYAIVGVRRGREEMRRQLERGEEPDPVVRVLADEPEVTR